MARVLTSVTIFGQSDDLIEVRGHITDEFSGGFNEWKYLHFSDGTIVKIGHDMDEAPLATNGKRKGWHVEVVKLGNGTATRALDPLLDDEGTEREYHYSDKIELVGNIQTVQCTRSLDGMTTEEIVEFFNDFDVRDYTEVQLRAAYKALTS